MPKRALWLVLAVLMTALPARAQLKATSSGQMSFGRFAAGSGGSITVNTAGARSRTGGVVLLTSVTAPARFDISDKKPASANLVYIVTLPANGSVIFKAGNNTMPVNNFVSTPSGTGTLVAGSAVLAVGATLQVGPQQPPGNYTGSVQIILEYQ